MTAWTEARDGWRRPTLRDLIAGAPACVAYGVQDVGKTLASRCTSRVEVTMAFMILYLEESPGITRVVARLGSCRAVALAHPKAWLISLCHCY